MPYFFLIRAVRYWGNPKWVGDTSFCPTVSSRVTTTHLIFRLPISLTQSRPKRTGF